MTNQNAIAALLKEMLEHASRIDPIVATVLSRQSTKREDYDRIFFLAQTMRIYRGFQAVCLLVDHGLHDAAGAALRVLIEQTYVMHSVSNDQTLLKELAQQSETENHKALTGLLKTDHTSRPNGLTNDHINRALEDLEAGSAFNAYFWAEKSGLTDDYQTMYRRLCTFSHGSMNGTVEYLKFDKYGEVTGISSRLLIDIAPNYVVSAASIMIHAVNVVLKSTPDDPDLETLNKMASEQKAFFDLYCELNPAAFEVDLALQPG